MADNSDFVTLQMKSLAGSAVFNVYYAAKSESPFCNPAEHRRIICMGVNTHINTRIPAKVKGEIGNTLGAVGCSYAMYGAIWLVVRPGSINHRIIWLFADDESKDTDYPVIRFDNITAGLPDVVKNHIPRRVTVHPLRGVA